MSATPPTPDEVRIAERYLSVLADVSRCADAVRNGDWQQLASTADDLCRRAALLAEAAGKIEHVEPAGTAPSGDAVVSLIMSRRDSSPAARLLHPAAARAVAKTALTDPFTHPAAPPNQGR